MPRPVHFEIHAQEPARAQAFYEAMFGWSFKQWGSQPYWMIKTGEGGPGIDGAMVARRGEAPNAAVPLPVIAWVCTIDVPDVDAYVAKAKAGGGENVVPKMAIPGVGWLAYCKDTEGNIFGLMAADPKAA